MRWTHGDQDASWPTTLAKIHAGFPLHSWVITGDDFWWSEVSDAANPDSESSIHDFQVLANNLALWQIPSNHGNAHLQLHQHSHCQPQQAFLALVLNVKEQENRIQVEN